MPTEQSTSPATGLPDNLNDLFQRIYAFIRSIFGTGFIAVIVGVIFLILLIITSLLLGI